jgi:hypothetical protein
VGFNLGHFRQKQEGNSKTSTTRVSELNVINNPLSASDRTVIGLLNDVKYMLGFDSGIKTIDLIWVESNLCFNPLKHEFHLYVCKSLVSASG